MKLAQIEVDGTSFTAVRVADGQLVRLADLAPQTPTLRAYLDADDATRAAVAQAVAAETATPTLARIAEADVAFDAPADRAATIWHVALNNVAADPTLMYRPKHPAYFTKPNAALTGAGRPIELKPHFGHTHNEPEVAVIIGRDGRDISVEDALDHVAGYTIVNDITSVGMRKEDRFHGGYPLVKSDGEIHYVEEVLTYPARYKGAASFLPVGPYVTTPDEAGDPMALQVTCLLDDEVIFDDTTANLHFSVAEAIFWISAHSELRAGDILCMGTAGNPGAEKKPLSYGDIASRGESVTVEIEGLGSLVNPVVHIDAPDPRLAFAPVDGLGTLIREHGLVRAELPFPL